MQFVDTNVPLHAISRDPAEQKAKARRDIRAEHDLTLQLQVQQEFYVRQPARTARIPSVTTRRSCASSSAVASPSLLRRTPVTGSVYGSSGT